MSFPYPNAWIDKGLIELVASIIADEDVQAIMDARRHGDAWCRDRSSFGSNVVRLLGRPAADVGFRPLPCSDHDACAGDQR
ncbi:hypothetical protein D3C85_1374680 [compost metagenome]